MSDTFLRLDYTNVLDSAVGADNGLTGQDFSSATPEIEAAFARARAARASWGFAKLPYAEDRAAEITELASELAADCEDFVVIGIGGSALGNIALHTSLNLAFYNYLPREERGDRPRVHVPDNVDPLFIKGLLSALDPRKTTFNVIAKSGSTAETLANFLVVRDFLAKELGEAWKERIVFTTDPEKGALRKLANELGIRALEVPPDVGGRFSVLSPVGLLSAAIEGVEIGALLDGARKTDERCRAGKWRDDPAFFSAVIHYLFDKRKNVRLSVMMPYCQRLREVADWFRQLWAESLGKRVDRQGREIFCGLTPIKALGATDQHSQVQLYTEGPADKLVTFLHVDEFGVQTEIPRAFEDEAAFAYLGGHTLNELLHAEEYATRAALTKAGRPSLTVSLPAVNPYYIGQLLYFLELQTAYAGELYDIDAFDQPGVEQGKVFTYALMGREGYEGARAELESMILSDPGAVME